MKRNIILFGICFLLMGADSNGCGGSDESLPNTPQVNPPPVSTCTADSCSDGCCQNNECVRDISNNACGAAGSKCEVCTVDKACDKAQGVCVARPIRVKVQPSQASIVPKDPSDGSDWDLDGSPPDVVVELRCPAPSGAQPFVTRTEEVESLTPQWTSGACDTLADVLVAQPIEFRLIDVDNLFDDDIASASYTLTAADLEKEQVELFIPGYVNSLVLKLSRYYQP